MPPYDYDPERLSDDWAEVDASLAVELETELRREMTDGHRLAGTALSAFSVRRQRKDVIFWLQASSTWAVVHLTWSVESDDKSPSAELCATWDDVIDFLTESARA